MTAAPRVTKIAPAPEDDKTPVAAPEKGITKEEAQTALEWIKKGEEAADKLRKEELTPEDKKEITNILVKKIVKPFIAVAALPFSLIPAIGGGIVLATATATLPLIAGAGAVAASLWTAGGIIRTLTSNDLEDQVGKAMDIFGKQLNPNAKPVVKDGKYFAKAGLGLGFSIAKLGTSVALFAAFTAASGFAALGIAALGVYLGIGGGFGTLMRTKRMFNDVKQKIEGSFLKDLPKEETAPVSAAPDLSPSPVTGVKAGADFNTSATATTANDNKIEAKPDLKVNAPRL